MPTLDGRRIPACVACGLAVLLMVLAGGPAILGQQPQEAGQNKWETEIRAFERADQAHPPKPGMIVFTGSSSIRRWETLAEEMAPLEVINRGFGGAQLDDVDLYLQRIVIPYKPRAVVLYAGDNDLAEGTSKTPETVLREFQQFVRIVHEALPQTWIYYICIKPSTLRWAQWPQMKAANELIAAYIRTQPRTQYIDIASPMLKPDGTPRRELLAADGLHPTPECYRLWTSIIKPVLMKKFGPAAKAARLLVPGRVTTASPASQEPRILR